MGIGITFLFSSIHALTVSTEGLVDIFWRTTIFVHSNEVFIICVHICDNSMHVYVCICLSDICFRIVYCRLVCALVKHCIGITGELVTTPPVGRPMCVILYNVIVTHLETSDAANHGFVVR